MNKFELGALQKMWLEQLRKHPERQMSGYLGYGTPQNYKACCLGELHLCAHRLANKKLPFGSDNRIYDDSTYGTLYHSYGQYGLNNSVGQSDKTFATSFNNQVFYSLAQANDAGISWSEIADIIEKNPENFFTKSV